MSTSTVRLPMMKKNFRHGRDGAPYKGWIGFDFDPYISSYGHPGELSHTWGLCGVREPEHLFPRRLVHTYGNRGLDVLKAPHYFPVSGRYIFDDVLKDIVEKFEPKLHQFIEMKTYRKGGQLLPVRYYCFNCIGIHSKGFIRNFTEDVVRRRGDFVIGEIVEYEPVVDQHCWMAGSQLCLSEEIADAFIATGVGKIFNIQPVMVI